MEFSELGELCSECGVLDYCPFSCDKCLNSFCIKHFNYSNHTCITTKPAALFVSCPRCKKQLSLMKVDVDQALVTHSLDCIKLHPYKYCAKKNCKHKHQITCKQCTKNYCISHRRNHSCK